MMNKKKKLNLDDLEDFFEFDEEEDYYIDDDDDYELSYESAMEP